MFSFDLVYHKQLLYFIKQSNSSHISERLKRSGTGDSIYILRIYLPLGVLPIVRGRGCSSYFLWLKLAIWYFLGGLSCAKAMFSGNYWGILLNFPTSTPSLSYRKQPPRALNILIC